MSGTVTNLHQTAEGAATALLARLDEIPLHQRVVKVDIWRFALGVRTSGGTWAYVIATATTYSSSPLYDDPGKACDRAEVMAARRALAMKAYLHRRDVNDPFAERVSGGPS